MATVGMSNLNSPATEPGPLTSDELDWWRRADMLGVDIDRIHKRPYIPAGCDQQGRIEPAEACTEMGVDQDDLSCASGIVWAVIVSLMVYAALTFAYLAFA